MEKGDGGEQTPMIYLFRDCQLDATRFELRRAGNTQPIEPQVLELLLYLVANRDRAVTRRELFEQLWRGRVVSESALNSAIKAARSAIGDDGKAQSGIRTLHRTGYRFVGEVEEFKDSAADVAVAGGPSPPDVSAGKTALESHVGIAERERTVATRVPAAASFVRGRVAAALGLVAAIGAFALLPRAARELDLSPVAASAASPATRAPAEVRKSLAVLPFRNLSADADEDYFAEGIGVEILIALSRLPDLQVTGRVSSAHFKGQSEPLPAIGERLGVAHLLTGSVRKAGERVRIAVELVDTADGNQVWADSYDRQVGDILSVQNEIAEHVATALQVKLGLGESGELGMTRNVAAYDEFLRGYSRFTEFRPDTIPLAIEHLHRAIALDEGFSRAWAYLYCVYMDGSSIVPERATEWRGKALEALDHAHGLTPDSPFVKIIDAREEMRIGQTLAARAALDALPGGYWTADRYVTRDVFLGRFAVSTGHGKQAIEVLERARAADPLSPIVAIYMTLAQGAAGDAVNALATSDRGLELGGSVPLLTRNALLLALGTGDRDEILRRIAATPNGASGHRALSESLAKYLDHPAAGRAELHRIAALPSPPDFVRSVLIAYWAAYYGDTQLALEQLGTVAHGAVDDGLLWRPVLSEVRKLPGFKELVRREGLVDYWRAKGWPDVCRPTAGEDFECGGSGEPWAAETGSPSA